MSRILFNFASRSRPGKFNAAIFNIITMAAETNMLIVAKIDSDDPERDHYLNNGCAIVLGQSISKVHAINRDIPAAGWDILVNMSDDMHFLTPGFDNIIRQHCGPDDFVHFPDGHVDRRLCTMSIIGRKYYERDGYVYHPDYKSLWCDNEAMSVAKRRGRYKYVNQQIFEHRHPAWIGGEKDALLQHTESFHAEDRATFIRRRRAGFPK